jgi:hypothetical protein
MVGGWFNSKDEDLQVLGFRLGARGTHSSRTIMLAEISTLLGFSDSISDLSNKILEENILAKPTSSGRRLALQRLREIYALQPRLRMFSVFFSLAQLSKPAIPQLALLMALARDPLLRSSADAVVGLELGAELSRDKMRDAVGRATGSRLNPSIADKVCRNAASSWAQAGLLEGRTFKRRVKLRAEVSAFVFGVWLANSAGLSQDDIPSSFWMRVLDMELRDWPRLVEQARANGLIIVRQQGTHQLIDLAPTERMAYR